MKDQSGHPFVGATVTFAAPTSGAGGTFAGNKTSVTETTNASGVATAPAFTANGTAGTYTVTASVTGIATPASFSLTNTSPAVTKPAATTVAASLITSTGATLNASVNPEGSATTYIFVYGTDSTLSSGTTKTTPLSAGSGTSAEFESLSLTSLAPGTTYYFEVQATNAGGTADGTILHFTTSSAAVTKPAATTVAATSITTTGATLNASVTPEGTRRPTSLSMAPTRP